tara:strand:- start:466 stop:657 length:192 start_codon:yes stop_codon:yes gene_type:complete
MPIFARWRTRICHLKQRFSIQKIATSQMTDLSTEAYQALLIFEAQVPKPIDFSLYRAETKDTA